MAKTYTRNQPSCHAVIVKTLGIFILVSPPTITQDPSTSSWITYSKISRVYYLICTPSHSSLILNFDYLNFHVHREGTCFEACDACSADRPLFGSNEATAHTALLNQQNSLHCFLASHMETTSDQIYLLLLIQFIYYCFCLTISYRKVKLELTSKVLLKSSFAHGEGRLKSSAGFI